MQRIDAELVRRGICKSRERAKVLIKKGCVLVNGEVCIKPSNQVLESDNIISTEEDIRYVGRGGLKLEKALSDFNIDLSDKACLDIGASTGGFTDCMLQRGALKVFAVDVGTDQLDEKLLSDNRVVNLEKTDIRNVNEDILGKKVDFIAIDVSFISLKQILPKASELIAENGILLILIKPQFEAGRENIGKNGIVKDKKVHVRVLENLDNFMRDYGLYAEKYTYSPIKGGSGNIEYLAKLGKKDCSPNYHDFKLLVEESFRRL